LDNFLHARAPGHREDKRLAATGKITGEAY
jgi:hypothetical protein